MEKNINIPENWIKGKVLSKVGYYDPEKELDDMEDYDL